MLIGAIVPEAVPFVSGGFERLWEGIVDHINAATDHRAELVSVPSPEADLHEVMDSYRHFAELDVSQYDMVFTSKYPAWMIEHPHHVVYMAHPLRGLYDTYPSDWPHHCEDDLAEKFRAGIQQRNDRAALPDIFDGFDALVSELGVDHPALTHPSPLGRTLIHTLDRIGMAPRAIRRYAAISATVAGRENYFPHSAQVEVMLPPTTVSPGRRARSDFFFTASRLDKPKRLHLLIEAMSHVQADTRLLIAGDGPERTRLETLASNDDRIELLGRVSDEELSRLYSEAIAVPFIPQDEDYGLIALEAMASGAPVITCIDSGGPRELVHHGANGFVVEATAQAIGTAINHLAVAPALADDLGAAATADVSHINWPDLVRSLLRHAPLLEPRNQPVARRSLPRVLILNTFSAHDPKGGGQLRALNLYRGLTSHFDVELLSLEQSDRGHWERTSSDGFTEIAVPRSVAHQDFEWRAATAAGIPVSDLYGGLGIDLTPSYLVELRRRLDGADLLMLAHPYMQPALEIVTPSIPVIYDAYNVESVLKDSMIADTPAGDEIRKLVRDVEAKTLQLSQLVAVCSQEDAERFVSDYDEVPPAHLAPNGADLSSLVRSIGSTRVDRRRRWLHSMGADVETRLAIFLGSWHQPNLDAARDIHTIAAEMPETLFLMVGSHCDAIVGEVVPPNVLQLGVVSDATKRVLLAAANVGLNPMSAGSGTNLKLVEYLGAGLPTVSTPIGARGLPELDPALCVIAELDQFRSAVAEALDVDGSSLDAIAAAERARSVVEAEYDWSAIGDRLARRMLDVL